MTLRKRLLADDCVCCKISEQFYVGPLLTNRNVLLHSAYIENTIESKPLRAEESAETAFWRGLPVMENRL